MVQNTGNGEVKSGWRENWRERTLILLLLILNGAYIYTHPPKNEYCFKNSSNSYSIDGLKTNIEWSATYNAKIFISQSDIDAIEKSVQGLVCLGLNYVTSQYSANRLKEMGVGGIQLLLNNIAQIKKLDSLNIHVTLNKVGFFVMDSTFNEVFKTVDISKDSLTINSK